MSGYDTAGWRTALAWQRSLLLILVTATALAKLAADHGRLSVGIATGGVLLAATLTLYLATARGRVQRPDWPQHRRPVLRALSAVTVLAALLSVLTVLLTR